MKYPKTIYVAIETDANGDESLLAGASLAEMSEFSGEDDRTEGRLAVYTLSHHVDVKTTIRATRAGR